MSEPVNKKNLALVQIKKINILMKYGQKIYLHQQQRSTNLSCLQRHHVCKEYSFKQHYETKHADRIDDFIGKARRDKIAEMQRT